SLSPAGTDVLRHVSFHDSPSVGIDPASATARVVSQCFMPEAGGGGHGDGVARVDKPDPSERVLARLGGAPDGDGCAVGGDQDPAGDVVVAGRERSRTLELDLDRPGCGGDPSAWHRPSVL